MGTLIVMVTNTDRDIIDFFARRWCGYVKDAHTRPECKQAWAWVLAAKKAAAFLSDIQPYLVSERVKAKVSLGLSFQRQKVHYARGLPDAYEEWQWFCFEQMKRLNKRGAAA